MSARGDMRKVIRAAQRAGLALEYGGRHPRLVDPRTGHYVVIAGTPSCAHAYKHVLSDMHKNFGVQLS